MKKVIKTLAVIAAISMLAIGASAAVEAKDDGEGTLELVLTEAGDVHGVFTISAGDGVEITRVRGGEYNPETGVVAFAGTGYEVGDDLITISYTGEGLISIVANEGTFADMDTIAVEVGEGDLTVATDPTTEPDDTTTTEDDGGQQGGDDNPKGGVVLFALAPLALAGGVAVATKKRK